MAPSSCRADDGDCMDPSSQPFGGRVVSIPVAAVAVSLVVQPFIREHAAGLIKAGALGMRDYRPGDCALLSLSTQWLEMLFSVALME